MDRSLASISVSLVKAIDDRLGDFKRRLPSGFNDTPEHSSKKLKIEAKQIKKAGNQQQFDHGVKVLGKFESAFDALAQRRIDKAKDALKEGMDLVLHRIKLIRIADKSEFGWETVNQYEADELASDSEDDKRIYRPERRAEKKQKDRKKKRSVPSRSLAASTSSSATFPITSYTSSRVPVVRSSLGPCFACGKFGHLQVKCPQKASFQIGCGQNVPKPQL